MGWLLLAMASARADQCAWVTEAQGEAALRRLAPGTPWAELCEPCGDIEPVVRQVGQASFRAVDGGRVELTIDGRPIDLAYTFVRVQGETRYVNLAQLARCPTTGVSTRLEVRRTPTAGAPSARWLGVFESGAARMVIHESPGQPDRLGVRLEPSGAAAPGAARLQISTSFEVALRPPILATGLPGCSLVATPEPAEGEVEAVTLEADPGCGPLGALLAGRFLRR